jgi:ATP-dependent Clp protease ATP-binding subunit ClpA
MFERFTQPARQAVVLARNEARALHHPEIDAHHLLLGVLLEPHGAGGRILDELGVQVAAVREAVRDAGPALPDAEALRVLGIDLDAVRRSVEDAFGPGALERRRQPGRARRRSTGYIPVTRDAKTVLELSLREALRLRSRVIGTEHVLLGLTRYAGTRAARLLRDAGVDNVVVTEHVQRQAAAG